MTSGVRRQGTLLLLIALAGGIGIGVGEWRRRHPELVERLERFDHVDPGPAVAAPFRVRAASRSALPGGHLTLGHEGLDRNDRLESGQAEDAPFRRRDRDRPEHRPGRAPRPPAGASTTSASEPVDLNHASAEALAGLPGVGPALAQTIVAARESRGRFTSVEDLRWVRGIGPARLERLRPFVTVSP